MTSENSISEYAENPFISGLPPPQSLRQIYQQLLIEPSFSEAELCLPPHLRKHCIARLNTCFLPQARQVDLADRFALLLRQGYLSRNPLKPDFVARLQNGYERIQEGSLDTEVSRRVKNTASSFALVGCPGVGKTLGMAQILDTYPQTVEHSSPFSLIQIVWLRLEAPTLGSVSQLCVDFFNSVDELLGTDYTKRYATKEKPDRMLIYMAHIAQLHAVGALIIDEVQHLRDTKVNTPELMNFLVKLVNTIGVPVILIGTPGALPILQGNFSQARRATGLGSLRWDRMPPGKDWEKFLDHLWRFQWTSPRTDLTDELRAAFYDECQGVADLTLKLFMLVQLRLVSISESRGGEEIITTKLVRSVAKDEFSLVAPMLKALRENDAVGLNRFDDLRSLDSHIGVVLGRALHGTSIPTLAPMPEPRPSPDSEQSIQSVIDLLVQGGVAKDIAQIAAREAAEKHPSGDFLQVLSEVAKILSASPPKAKRPKQRPRPKCDLPESDLRKIVATGADEGMSAYQSLLLSGVIQSPMAHVSV